MGISSRNELEALAAALNITAANYPNDSKLEQQIIYRIKTMAASGAATTLAAPASSYGLSGGANV